MEIRPAVNSQFYSLSRNIVFAALLLLVLCFVISCRSSSSATTGKEGLDSLLSELNYVRVPGGNFLMGSPDEVSGVMLEERERPQHSVLITDSFEMGKYEVTQTQWEAVMGSNPSAFKGSELPVTNISWNDVQQFINKLQSFDNQYTYRLPTEAEWEYACRAGSTGHFSGEDLSLEKKEEPKPKEGKRHKKEPVGSKVNASLNEQNTDDRGKNLRLMAWYVQTSLNRPHPIGKLKPNAWGLYDMHGNVWEWCQDWFEADYYKNSPDIDPQGPPKGTAKVNRGGSWQAAADMCRASVRGYDPPNERNHVIGFRLVRVKKVAEMKLP